MLLCPNWVYQDWCNGRHQSPAFSSRADQLRSATNPSCAHFAVRPGMVSDGRADREWKFHGVKIFVPEVADWKTRRPKNWEARILPPPTYLWRDVSLIGFPTRPSNMEASSRRRSESDGEVTRVGTWFSAPEGCQLRAVACAATAIELSMPSGTHSAPEGLGDLLRDYPLSAWNAGASGVVGASTSFGARKRALRTSCCALLRA